MATKIKIKMNGESAEKFLNGSNENNIRSMSSINPSGRAMLDENPSSRQAEGTHEDENSDITRKVKPTRSVPTSPEANVDQGYNLVAPVNRDLPADSPEVARRKLNQVRDLRTNLGRTIPSTSVVE